MNVIIMENDKVKKKKKRAVRLTEEERKKIYKEEQQKSIKKNLNEMQERLVVVSGNIGFVLYILFSSFIIGVGATMYIVISATEEIREGFITNPFGITADLAFVSIMAFVFWAMFGLFSFSLFLKSEEILEKKPEYYKKMKLWNWRK